MSVIVDFKAEDSSVTSAVDRLRRSLTSLQTTGTRSADAMSRLATVNLSPAERQLTRINQSLTTMQTRVSSTISMFRTLGGVIAGLAIASYFTRAGDAVLMMNSRLRLVVGPNGGVTQVRDSIRALSVETRGSAVSLTNTFSRLGLALRGRYDTRSLLQATRSLQMASVISGGAPESIDAAMIQLTQGLASGELRGAELLSVLEQVPRVAEAIADGMGFPFEELKQRAEDGQLTTTAVFEALIDQADELEGEFSQIGVTFSSGISVLGGALQALFGDINDYFNVSERWGARFLSWADGIYRRIGPIIRLIDLIIEYGKEIASSIVAPFRNLDFGTTFQNTMGAMITAASSFASAVISIFSDFIAKAQAIFYAFYDWLVGNSIWPDTMEELMAWAKLATFAILGTFLFFSKSLRGIFIGLFRNPIFLASSAIFSALFYLDPDRIEAVLSTISNAFQGIAVGFLDGASLIYGQLSAVFGTFWNFITATLITSFQLAQDTFTSFEAFVRSIEVGAWFQDFATGFKTFFSTIWTSIWTSTDAVGDFILQKFLLLKDRIVSLLDVEWGNLIVAVLAGAFVFATGRAKMLFTLALKAMLSSFATIAIAENPALAANIAKSIQGAFTSGLSMLGLDIGNFDSALLQQTYESILIPSSGAQQGLATRLSESFGNILTLAGAMVATTFFESIYGSALTNNSALQQTMASQISDFAAPIGTALAIGVLALFSGTFRSGLGRVFSGLFGERSAALSLENLTGRLTGGYVGRVLRNLGGLFAGYKLSEYFTDWLGLEEGSVIDRIATIASTLGFTFASDFLFMATESMQDAAGNMTRGARYIRTGMIAMLSAVAIGTLANQFLVEPLFNALGAGNFYQANQEMISLGTIIASALIGPAIAGLASLSSQLGSAIKRRITLGVSPNFIGPLNRGQFTRTGINYGRIIAMGLGAGLTFYFTDQFADALGLQSVGAIIALHVVTQLASALVLSSSIAGVLQLGTIKFAKAVARSFLAIFAKRLSALIMLGFLGGVLGALILPALAIDLNPTYFNQALADLAQSMNVSPGVLQIYMAIVGAFILTGPRIAVMLTGIVTRYLLLGVSGAFSALASSGFLRATLGTFLLAFLNVGTAVFSGKGGIFQNMFGENLYTNIADAAVTGIAGAMVGARFGPIGAGIGFAIGAGLQVAAESGVITPEQASAFMEKIKGILAAAIAGLGELGSQILETLMDMSNWSAEQWGRAIADGLLYLTKQVYTFFNETIFSLINNTSWATIGIEKAKEFLQGVTDTLAVEFVKILDNISTFTNVDSKVFSGLFVALTFAFTVELIKLSFFIITSIRAALVVAFVTGFRGLATSAAIRAAAGVAVLGIGNLFMEAFEGKGLIANTSGQDNALTRTADSLVTGLAAAIILRGGVVKKAIAFIIGTGLQAAVDQDVISRTTVEQFAAGVEDVLYKSVAGLIMFGQDVVSIFKEIFAWTAQDWTNIATEITNSISESFETLFTITIPGIWSSTSFGRNINDAILGTIDFLAWGIESAIAFWEGFKEGLIGFADWFKGLLSWENRDVPEIQADLAIVDAAITDQAAVVEGILQELGPTSSWSQMEVWTSGLSGARRELELLQERSENLNAELQLSVRGIDSAGEVAADILGSEGAGIDAYDSAAGAINAAEILQREKEVNQQLIDDTYAELNLVRDRMIELAGTMNAELLLGDGTANFGNISFQIESLQERIEELQAALAELNQQRVDIEINMRTIGAAPAIVTPNNGTPYATGGWVYGPGTGTSDSIRAMLSNGEFVVTARAAAANAGLLEAINGGGGTSILTGRAADDAIEQPSVWERFSAAVGDVWTGEDYGGNGGDTGTDTDTGAGTGTAGVGAGADDNAEAITRTLEWLAENTQFELQELGGMTEEQLDSIFTASTRILEIEKLLGDASFGNYETRQQLTTELETQLELLESMEESSNEYAESIRSDFQSALSEFLSSKTSIGEFFRSILDSFTMGVIDRFTEVLTDTIFDNLGLEEMLGNLFNGLDFKPITDGLINAVGAVKTAGAAGGGGFFNNLFGWIGGLFSGGAAIRVATGGRVIGPGTGTSDSIPAWLSNGEFVVNAAATRRWGPTLEAINSGAVDRFREGGQVGNTAALAANSTGSSAGSSQEFNLQITGDVSRITRKEILRMIPELAGAINLHNREKGLR